jgi:hypothetical protein
MIKKSRWKVLLFLSVVLCVNIFVIYFIKQERYIYFWDWSFYCSQYQNLRNLFANDPINALQTLWNSIRNEDHNFLSVLFLMPFNFHLFGNDRLAYILAITNIFFLPSALLFIFLLRKIIPDNYETHQLVTPLIIFINAILLPQFWIPILSGYYDIAGVFLILLILYLYRKESFEQQRVLNLLTIGFLLTFLILLRRFYAYWVVSFFMAVIIEKFIFTFQQHRFSFKHHFIIYRNLAIVSLISLLLFFSLAGPIAQRMLETNYADIYSAYKRGVSFFNFFRSFYNYFGAFTVLIFITGIVQSIANKKTRYFALFLMIQFISIILLFTRVQDFDPHHYYLLIPAMVIFISLSVVMVYSHFNKKLYKFLFVSGYIVILLLNFSVVFIPKVFGNYTKTAFWLPGIRHYPLVRNDLGEMDNLLKTLQNLSESNNDLIYVVSSSGILNDEILKNSCSLSKMNICNNILQSSHVDKRDGFPMQFLSAHYIVITDPIQYQFKPENQRVIGILADEVLQQNEMYSHYKKLPYGFSLDNNVRVYIYEKSKPYTGKELDRLSQTFISFYPGKKELFEINTICHLISQKEVGDGFAEVSCYKNFIYLVPGTNKPSTVFLKLNKYFKTIKMVFAFDNPDRIPKSCSEKAGEINVKISSDGKTIFQYYINYKQPISYQLDLKDIDILKITADNGRNGPDCDWFIIKDIRIE